LLQERQAPWKDKKKITQIYEQQGKKTHTFP